MAPAAGLIFFGLLAYCNAIRHPFVHDDVVFILNNPHIADLNHWLDAFLGHAAAGGLNTYYRPVLEIIYRLEYHFFGFHPFGFHLVNVILHITNGVLLFSLLQKLGLRQGMAWAVVLLFLVHPVQTEAVSCICGISNLWMALGILLGLHAYLNRWYAATLLAFILAFWGKEQAIMFVPLVVAMDYARGTRNFRGWLFFGMAGGALLWLRQCVTGASLLHDITVSPGELYLRLAAIPRDLGMYLRLIFYPTDLHYYRSTDILQPNGLAWCVFLLCAAGIFYLLYRHPKARPTVALGLGWSLAALLPVLNIAPLINEYSFILTPEHFLYLPIVGILIIAVCAADHFFRHFKKLVLGVVVAGCLVLTWHQNTFWANEIVLFERMLRFEPDFGRGHWLLAKAYWLNGEPQDAEEHFRKAYRIMSSYAAKASNATARNFYIRYQQTILSDWARNDCALGKPWPGMVCRR